MVEFLFYECLVVSFLSSASSIIEYYSSSSSSTTSSLTSSSIFLTFSSGFYVGALKSPNLNPFYSKPVPFLSKGVVLFLF
jgi:hypothetical protein